MAKRNNRLNIPLRSNPVKKVVLPIRLSKKKPTFRSHYNPQLTWQITTITTLVGLCLVVWGVAEPSAWRFVFYWLGACFIYPLVSTLFFPKDKIDE